VVRVSLRMTLLREHPHSGSAPRTLGVPCLKQRKYGAIYADPPWSFRNQMHPYSVRVTMSGTGFTPAVHIKGHSARLPSGLLTFRNGAEISASRPSVGYRDDDALGLV
jgi:hypothetical protein